MPQASMLPMYVIFGNTFSGVINISCRMILADVPDGVRSSGDISLSCFFFSAAGRPDAVTGKRITMVMGPIARMPHEFEVINSAHGVMF